MAGEPEGMGGEATDEGPFDPDEFDGVVGLPLESAEGRPSQPSQIYVSAPDGPSGSWAMGLEDDVTLLARTYAAGGIDLCRELIEAFGPRPSGTSRSARQKEEVHVALHGLALDSSDEEELRDLISMLVEMRIADDKARP
jgi:hypothetical protein